MKRYLNAFVVILTTMAVVLSISGFFFSETLLNMLGTPEDMMGQANVYLQINFVGVLFLFGYNFISTVLRALGDSKTPLRFVMIAVLLNIVLDPLLIAGFNLGIAGAAYATIIAQGTAFIYGVIHFLRFKLVPFSFTIILTRKEDVFFLKLVISSVLQ